MPTWPSFLTPAGIVDFPDQPDKQAALSALWSQRVSGFTDQAILGGPWQSLYSANQNFYVNPLYTDIPTSAAVANIQWAGFPRRITYYFPNYSLLDQRSLANTGYKIDGVTTFGQIPKNTCPPPVGDSTPVAFGPYGPRGWQDEYCEWSTSYDDLSKPVAERKVLRIDFVCENPEYWNSLWAIDPQRAVDIYNSALNYPDGTPEDDKNVQKVVTLDDLVLKDPKTGATVIDPFTGGPTYDPLNKFNSGPEADPTTGGAMHLTATPNTLQTELGLAAGATVQRQANSGGNNTNTDWLICCSQYGQLHRNSDPHIGQSVNLVVQRSLKVSLANPPGLYLQAPVWPSEAWVKFPPNAPAGAKLQDYFRVARGTEQMNGPDGQPMASNFYLHCVMEVPKSQGFCLSDIEIMATDPATGFGTFYPISGGAQIAELLKVQINAVAFPVQPGPQQFPCVTTAPSPYPPQPLQMLYADQWNAANATVIPNVVNQPMTLASNTVIVPPRVEPGRSVDLVLTFNPDSSGSTAAPSMAFVAPDGTISSDVTISNVRHPYTVTYAVPGNSYPSSCSAVSFTAQVSRQAQPAVLGLRLTSPGMTADPPPPPIPAFLTIAPLTIAIA
jgi:hypothetical protein